MNINLNGSLTIVAYSKKSTDTFNNAITPSGSCFVSNTITLTTGSWVLVPTGSNKDFLIGQFSNNDNVDNVWVSLGATSSVASILTPLSPTCLLTYSGSIQPYVYLTGAHGTASFDYTIASLN